MIIDTSAVLAVLLGEPEQADFVRLITQADRIGLSAGSWIELAAVSTRRYRGKLDPALNAFLTRFQVIIEPVTQEQARVGQAAYRQFGIGSGHKAGLNFGDCFPYALAKVTQAPLLFKGDDFAHTDLEKA